MSDTFADAIVIGAGAAGLSSAAVLARGGARVAVFEARDRVGGRVWSVPVADGSRSVELGAEFVHGGNSQLWSLIRAAGLEKKSVPENHWFAQHGTRAPLGDAFERTYALMERIGGGYAGDFGAWLREHGDAFSEKDRLLARTFVEGFHAAPVDRMSAHTLFAATQAPEEEQSRLSGRYDRVFAALQNEFPAERVTLRLNAAVRSIEWSRGEVRAVCADGSACKARVAIVTLPLGVLRLAPHEIGAVIFKPALQEKTKIIRALGWGHVMRIVIRFIDTIWNEPLFPPELRERGGEGFGFIHSARKLFPVWWSRAPEPIVVGWTGGPGAETLTALPDEEIFRTALSALSDVTGCAESDLAARVVEWKLHNWTNDPFTRGAYSFSAAGAEHGPEQLAAPVEQTLFFAGEATAGALHLGTVHGALATGERAGQEALAALAH